MDRDDPYGEYTDVVPVSMDEAVRLYQEAVLKNRSASADLVAATQAHEAAQRAHTDSCTELTKADLRIKRSAMASIPE